MKPILILIASLASLVFSADYLRPGLKIPEFQLRTLDNSDKISSDAYKGKYLVIDFWASWCKPSEWGLPRLQEFQKKYPQVHFITVNQDLKPKTGLIFAKTYKVDLPILYDGRRKMGDAFTVNIVPTLIFVGPKGRVLWRKDNYVFEDIKSFENILKEHLGIDTAEAEDEINE